MHSKGEKYCTVFCGCLVMPIIGFFRCDFLVNCSTPHLLHIRLHNVVTEILKQNWNDKQNYISYSLAHSFKNNTTKAFILDNSIAKTFFHSSKTKCAIYPTSKPLERLMDVASQDVWRHHWDAHIFEENRWLAHHHKELQYMYHNVFILEFTFHFELVKKHNRLEDQARM